MCHWTHPHMVGLIRLHFALMRVHQDLYAVKCWLIIIWSSRLIQVTGVRKTSWAALTPRGQMLRMITWLSDLLRLFKWLYFNMKQVLTTCWHLEEKSLFYHWITHHRKSDPTVARLQVVLDVSIEVTAQAAGPAHVLRAEFDVNGSAASLPG